MVRIAVVGAGIVGIATAVNIQKAIPHAKITIIADKFSKETTSSGAGGIFRPTAQLVKGVPPETINNVVTHGAGLDQVAEDPNYSNTNTSSGSGGIFLPSALNGIPLETVKKWVMASWDYYTSLAMSAEAGESGQSLVPGYVVSDNKEVIENALYKDFVFNFRLLTQDELKRMNFPGKYGSFFQTVITQTNKFMPYLTRQFKEKGGMVEFRRLGRLTELAGDYDIVVNCSGLGSQYLVPDDTMYPVKGQLVMVKAPWIKTFMYCDAAAPGLTYFIPHDEKVVVGGTREEGNFSTFVDKRVEATILERAAKVLPQVQGAEVIGSWSGIRPSRDPLRLEKELVNVDGKKLRMVHNYGHGANGVSLSWGTSVEAARLTKEWADEIPKQQSRL